MNKGSILFICKRNSVSSQMAEAFARQMAPPEIEVLSAGMEPGDALHPLAVSVMEEYGLDLSAHYPKKITDLKSRRFDVAITVCPDIQNDCPPLAGAPATIPWQVADPVVYGDSGPEAVQAFKNTAAEIKSLVEGFFSRGYFAAFFAQKKNTDRIIDNLSEGVLAHDLNRIIFYFSRGAERMTGLSATEVIGRDCHDVFIPRLCGDNCSFCDGQEVVPFRKKCYSTIMPEIRGERKEMDVNVVPLLGDNGEMNGVVASFSEKISPDISGWQSEEKSFAGIIGGTEKMRRIFQQIRDLAQYDAPVHIYGETGTGKELVARAIHKESVRRDHPFVPINCGALPEGLVESELFGHVRGSFSGAVRDKKGRFELADRGTIFLDEIAELPKNVQVKLLRFLQEGVLEKVGSEKHITADVRIICATNKDLKQEVAKGNFRDDLYYRLNVIPIVLPPLRERKNDIGLLVEHSLKHSHYKGKEGPPEISREAMSTIISYEWPGNVRELENALQFAVIKCQDNLITPADLPLELINHIPVNHISEETHGGHSRKLDTQTVKEALEKAGGNKSKAARLLGVGRATLYRFLNEHPDIPPAAM